MRRGELDLDAAFIFILIFIFTLFIFTKRKTKKIIQNKEHQSRKTQQLHMQSKDITGQPT